MTINEETNPNTSQSFLKSTAVLGIALIFSQLCGLLSKSFIGSTFGGSPELDAYMASNRLTETVFNLVAGGALASAFVPAFSTLLDRDDRNGAWKLASNIANLLTATLLVVSVLFYIFAEPIARNFLVPGFTAEKPELLRLTAQLLRVQLPSILIFGLSGLMMGVLNTHGNFLLPGLAPAMYQIGILIGVLFLSKPFGIFGLAYGAVLGATLHFLAQLPGLLRLKTKRYFHGLGLRDAQVREVIKLMIPRQIGASAVQLNFLVNNFIASFLAHGSISAISLGLTIMLMPQAAIAQSVATVSLPLFSVQASRGELDRMREALAGTFRLVLLLSLPAAAGLILYSRPIVRLIFERRAFDATMSDMVQWALIWYAVGLVSHCIVEVVSRAFYAVQDTKTPVIVLFFAMGINMLLSLGLTRVFAALGKMPHGGIALANSIATTLEMITLLILMRRRLGGLSGTRLKRGLLQAGTATAAMIAWILAWQRFSPTLPMLAYLGIGIIGAVLVYALVCIALNVEELALFRKFLRRE